MAAWKPLTATSCACPCLLFQDFQICFCVFKSIVSLPRKTKNTHRRECPIPNVNWSRSQRRPNYTGRWLTLICTMGEAWPIPGGPGTIFLGDGCSLVESQIKVCHIQEVWAHCQLVQAHLLKPKCAIGEVPQTKVCHRRGASNQSVPQEMCLKSKCAIGDVPQFKVCHRRSVGPMPAGAATDSRAGCAPASYSSYLILLLLLMLLYSQTSFS